MASLDDDLLAPSLGEADDALDFDAPWNPWSLIYASFFGGLVTAGILYSLNYRRLGQPDRFAPCLAACLVLALGAFSAMIATGALERDADEEMRSWRLGMRVATLVVAGGLAALQRHRFQIFERHGGDSAPLFVPGLLAVLAGAAISIGMAFVLALLLGN